MKRALLAVSVLCLSACGDEPPKQVPPPPPPSPSGARIVNLEFESRATEDKACSLGFTLGTNTTPVRVFEGTPSAAPGGSATTGGGRWRRAASSTANRPHSA